MGRRIAVFGQGPFGRDVLVRLIEAGHAVVWVDVPPDRGRPDPLAEEAVARGLPLARHARFRRRGKALPEVVEAFRGAGAELAVLPYTTVILPPEIVEAPPLGSLCFHPSLLPRYRGGAAIPWQIILGERETGVTVFRPDAGVDAGPIVVQRGGVEIADDDTAGSLYFRKLYPLGLTAVLEAVEAVDRGTARPQPQDESRASFQGLVTDEIARVDWTQSAEALDRLLRGCDPQPGAHALFGGDRIRLYDVRLRREPPRAPAGTVVDEDGGRLLVAARDGLLVVGRIRRDGGEKRPAADAGLGVGDRLE